MSRISTRRAASAHPSVLLVVCVAALLAVACYSIITMIAVARS